MNLTEIFEKVESSEFAAYLGVASGFTILKMGLEDSQLLQQLISEIQIAPGKKSQVFQRLLSLLPANPHSDYAHPFDAAVTGYLYALSEADSALAYHASERVLKASQFWWARRFAAHIQETLQTARRVTIVYAVTAIDVQQPRPKAISSGTLDSRKVMYAASVKAQGMSSDKAAWRTVGQGWEGKVKFAAKSRAGSAIKRGTI